MAKIVIKHVTAAIRKNGLRGGIVYRVTLDCGHSRNVRTTYPVAPTKAKCLDCTATARHAAA